MLASCSRGISSEKTATPEAGLLARLADAAVLDARLGPGSAMVLRRRDVDREVEDERRLAHAGARRDDGELAVVQTGGLGVEALEAGRRRR